MPPTGYQSVQGEQDDAVTLVRPVTYYGEGPFDPPSSDDEEDAFLEKDASVNPDMEGEGGLVIGGTKKVPLSVHIHYKTLCSQDAATFFSKMSRYIPRISRRNSCHHWHVCCIFLYWYLVQSPRNKTYYHGSCLQWHIWRTVPYTSLGP